MQIQYKSPVKISNPKRTCIVCGSNDFHSLLAVEATEFIYNSKRVANEAIKCDACGTLNWLDRKVVGYIEPDVDSTILYDRHTTHYCLIGAGFDLGVRLLSRVDTEQKIKMLEVGCGFGYTSHYWETYRKKNAVALELAEYGKRGKKALGINIIEKYLESGDPPLGAFDIVYSSEVIEHVQDPQTFLTQLKRNLHEQGVLIITTPDAEFVNPKNDDVTVIAALSPGAHEFICSKEGLELLLSKEGFSDFLVERHNERLVAFAAKQGNINEHFVSSHKSSENYIGYLKILIKSEDPLVREGALYRLFKELVNKGDYPQSSDVLTDLLDLIEHKYEFNLWLFILERSTCFSERFDIDDYIIKLPPYMGPLVYYMGILHSHNEKDLYKKLNLFSLSTRLLKNTIESSPEFSQEARSLVNTALLHFRVALLDVLSYEHQIAIGNSANFLGELTPEEDRNTYISKLDKIKNQVFSID